MKFETDLRNKTTSFGDEILMTNGMRAKPTRCQCGATLAQYEKEKCTTCLERTPVRQAGYETNR